jgi:hypothetical protein
LLLSSPPPGRHAPGCQTAPGSPPQSGQAGCGSTVSVAPAVVNEGRHQAALKAGHTSPTPTAARAPTWRESQPCMRRGGTEVRRRVSRRQQARSGTPRPRRRAEPPVAWQPVRRAQRPAAAARRVSTHVCCLVAGPSGQTAQQGCKPALASCEVLQQQLWPATPPGGALPTTHPLLLERDVRHSLCAHGAATAPPAGRTNGAQSRAARRAALPRAAARGQ